MTENELRTEIERLSLDLHEARETIARLRKERDALREALWVCAEHNALHYGESHNTVIQARAALAQGEA